MGKYLKKDEAVSRFKVDFLPNIENNKDQDTINRAWVHYKNTLYDLKLIPENGLAWNLP